MNEGNKLCHLLVLQDCTIKQVLYVHYIFSGISFNHYEKLGSYMYIKHRENVSMVPWSWQKGSRHMTDLKRRKTVQLILIMLQIKIKSIQHTRAEIFL